MSFSALGLRAELLRAVSEQGYTEPTPIQAQAIPAVLAGRDLHGRRADRHRQDRRLHPADAAALCRASRRRRTAARRSAR